MIKLIYFVFLVFDQEVIEHKRYITWNKNLCYVIKYRKMVCFKCYVLLNVRIKYSFLLNLIYEDNLLSFSVISNKCN